jgi:serine/threonine protein kinase
MTPLLEGSVNIQGFGIYSPVYYLIFELASGDVRDVLDGFQRFDLIWCLRSLHNVAAGIQQLHGAGIAHQDVKPSNVIVIGKDESKIGDLGRASEAGKPSPHDLYSIAGDRGYAPLDLYYSDTGVDGFEKRFVADLYLLGSLFFFYFAQTSAVQALRSKLQGSKLGNKSFKQDLPDLQHAFEQTIADLRQAVEKVAKEIADDIMELVKQLCDPDPTKRGDPRWKGSVVPRYDLQRYISRLDLLSKKVESQLP